MIDDRIRFAPSPELRRKLARRARYAKQQGLYDDSEHLVARSVLELGSFQAWDRKHGYEPKKRG